MIRHFTYLSILFTSAMPFAFSSALAQSIEEEQAVPRLPESVEQLPGYQPEALVSISWGGEAGLMYNDNIFRNPNNEESDIIGIFSPGFTLRSDFDRHEYKVRGNVEVGEYFDNSENSYLDADLRGNTRYAATASTDLLAHARFRSDHVAIGSFIDDPDRRQSEPTDYLYYSAGAGIDTRQGRARLEAGAEWLRYDYDNTGRDDGSISINDDRDRDEYHFTARAGYYTQPQTLTYVKAVFNTKRYDEQVDNTALAELDSKGYGLYLGAEHGNRKDGFWFDANAGYLRQDYDDSFREEINAFGVNGDLLWRAAPDVTLTGLVSRSIEEASLTGASGYLRSRLGGGVAYDPLPQWTFGANLRYTNYDFEINPTGGRPDREDDVYDAALLAQYNITNIHNVGLEYNYIERESDDPTADYESNTLFLRFAAKY